MPQPKLQVPQPKVQVPQPKVQVPKPEVQVPKHKLQVIPPKMQSLTQLDDTGASTQILQSQSRSSTAAIDDVIAARLNSDTVDVSFIVVR